jgi:hypothetical protein
VSVLAGALCSHDYHDMDRYQDLFQSQNTQRQLADADAGAGSPAGLPAQAFATPMPLDADVLLRELEVRAVNGAVGELELQGLAGTGERLVGLPHVGVLVRR